jgi:hypothetical protein
MHAEWGGRVCQNPDLHACSSKLLNGFELHSALESKTNVAGRV